MGSDVISIGQAYTLEGARMTPTSLYREIPGFPGFYVDPSGNVLGKRHRVLRPCTDRDGYLRVSLPTGGVGRNYIPRGVHVLVCLAFKGPKPAGHIACHRDGTRTNNTPDNLYWGTHKNNSDDCARHGRHKGARRGELHHKAKLKEKDVAAIFELRKQGRKQYEIAAVFGVCRPLISLILAKKLWRSYAG